MSVGSFVTTKRHEPTTLALPIEVPELKCDTCKAKDATALCMGCYGSFCFDCFTKHRQKVSRDFGNLLWEHELFEALFKPYSAQTATVTTTTTSATASARKFDPLSVLAQIDSWEQDLESRIKTMAAAARQNVKSSIDERHDAIFWHYPKITDDLRTIQQAKRYVDRERSSIKETLCDINNNIESSSNTPSLCFRSEKIDLTKTMKLVSTRSGTERRPSTAAVASSSSSSDIARQPLEFANLSQPNEPFEKVERLGGGTAIGASDKFIIYTDIDEKLEKCDLCMIELSNKYRVVIPLAGVVDICWCAEADYFVILTKREVYTFNPNRKQLDPVYEIQPPNKTQFRRCTYAVAAYMGCVGNDLWLERLKELADEAGLITSYQEKANLPTGKCAVLITQNGRSMVADPGASHHFSCDYLDKPDSKSLIENAKIICCEAFFIQSSFDSLMALAAHAHRKEKIFCLTLSSKYIVQDRNGDNLVAAWQYVDYMFGYEEVSRWSVLLSDDVSDPNSIIIGDKIICQNPSGRTSFTFLTNILADGIKEYIWNKPSDMIDTNGCGEAFAGGFLAYIALEKSVDECVKAGMYCAYECLKLAGCTFPDKVSFDSAKL
ncbi:unnamed protein product [Didymodactylos carnosus]|uniref:adenosine kinase n=1 Tax=Didymodactylos carnosus TaxID=1234261 RepID=A0A814TKY3_9BILA|nr:unnamed protein product [Didymodactylos carnosus]CAF3925810.1 unnamed protein product [Didymodactylos carnosus]